MTKEELINELMSEVKSLKDLAKEELPEVAKEYILATKIQATFYLLLGLFIIFTASVLAFKGYNYIPENSYDDGRVGLWVGSGILTLLGGMLSLASIENLINVFYQPRRTAIEAITSLLKSS